MAQGHLADENALSQSPDATIVWAHLGDAQPVRVRDLLTKHANLYADVSSRNPYFQRGRPIDVQSLTNTDGTLKSDWQELFEDYPDRILLGLDLTTDDRWAQLDQLVIYYRSLFKQLSQTTAEMIGYKNAKRLLGLP